MPVERKISHESEVAVESPSDSPDSPDSPTSQVNLLSTETAALQPASTLIASLPLR